MTEFPMHMCAMSIARNLQGHRQPCTAQNVSMPNFSWYEAIWLDFVPYFADYCKHLRNRACNRVTLDTRPVGRLLGVAVLCAVLAGVIACRIVAESDECYKQFICASRLATGDNRKQFISSWSPMTNLSLHCNQCMDVSHQTSSGTHRKRSW